MKLILIVSLMTLINVISRFMCTKEYEKREQENKKKSSDNVNRKIHSKKLGVIKNNSFVNESHYYQISTCQKQIRNTCCAASAIYLFIEETVETLHH